MERLPFPKVPILFYYPCGQLAIAKNIPFKSRSEQFNI